LIDLLSISSTKNFYFILIKTSIKVIKDIAISVVLFVICYRVLLLLLLEKPRLQFGRALIEPLDLGSGRFHADIKQRHALSVAFTLEKRLHALQFLVRLCTAHNRLRDAMERFCRFTAAPLLDNRVPFRLNERPCLALNARH
jgi:hypothetical protein